MGDSSDRGRRLAHQQHAYELQIRGGLEGAARWTVVGTAVIGAAHYFSPGFRKQTWAIKAFLLSSFTIFGLVVGADDYLLKYEQDQRTVENAIRREARNALALQGIIATEGEIRKWRKAKEEAERRANVVAALDAAEGCEDAEASFVAKLADAKYHSTATAAALADAEAVGIAAAVERALRKD
ncbi:hypothetical protein Q8F55_000730 [Vanrija albida]|uniref:HIG1 domain-containing protein n=1 Tax=Vanrija albida TaxID=181172 RepID=A0ABR3QF34_9TREE